MITPADPRPASLEHSGTESLDRLASLRSPSRPSCQEGFEEPGRGPLGLRQSPSIPVRWPSGSGRSMLRSASRAGPVRASVPPRRTWPVAKCAAPIPTSALKCIGSSRKSRAHFTRARRWLIGPGWPCRNLDSRGARDLDRWAIRGRFLSRVIQMCLSTHPGQIRSSLRERRGV